MSAGKDIIKNFNVLVDGRGYAGEVNEFTPPQLSRTVERFRAGGMDASVPIDMGQEDMESTFSTPSMHAEVQKLWGMNQGASVPLVFRGALVSQDETVKPVVYTMRGKIRIVNEGTISAGGVPSIAYTYDPIYFKKEIDGETVTEIDVENMICSVNGVDQLEQRRAAIGL